MEGHELQRFLDQMAVELADEYERIRLRATEDPGTAGDEGEENWANLIREIVPASYPVVTKGRILSADGRASPQIDVLVLSPAYPPFLVRKAKKVYLAEAVVAAFECKLTLKTKHVLEAARTAALVRTMTDRRSGDPEAELFGTPFYGVLAHSHSWKGQGSSPMTNVRSALSTALDSAQHPRDLLNLVCVADLATWTLMTAPWVGPPVREEPQVLTSISAVSSTLQRRPLLDMMEALLFRMAWQDPSMRGVASYFAKMGARGQGESLPVGSVKELMRSLPGGVSRHWPTDEVLAPATRRELMAKSTGALKGWDPWDVFLA
ncbi:DUF6602 domain-containing protein [Streptomyces virginiae]|uniref:DUF6602 domain-containing protein n=1 Tax=Streptomyces virginiae TaxID=1961 RepID=A0ABZ1TTD2_STRVG|nr:DUF6602 domain-containing protein [Streptomyces virginiae]